MKNNSQAGGAPRRGQKRQRQLSPRSGPYTCGLNAAIDVMAGKWKALIVCELDLHTVRRLGQLRRDLYGISEKVLIQQLRELEADELVHREVFREVPPRVEYSLTEQGRQLSKALRPLDAWGTKRITRIGAKIIPRSSY